MSDQDFNGAMPQGIQKLVKTIMIARKPAKAMLQSTLKLAG